VDLADLQAGVQGLKNTAPQRSRSGTKFRESNADVQTRLAEFDTRISEMHCTGMIVVTL
jgi:hypothetical protein